jgi:hypothetical protein
MSSGEGRAGVRRGAPLALAVGQLPYGLGLAVFPTSCGDALAHTGKAQGIVTVAWNRKDASRQVVLVVDMYPLSPELEAAVRDLQVAAFCGGG